jgi:hypothetical protein
MVGRITELPSRLAPQASEACEQAIEFILDEIQACPLNTTSRQCITCDEARETIKAIEGLL